MPINRNGIGPGEPAVGFNPISTLLESVERELVEERALSQFLGVSLRGIMETAELGRYSAIARSALHPDDKELDQKAVQSDRAFQRARHAIRTLERSHLNVGLIDDDHFDDHFEVTFED